MKQIKLTTQLNLVFTVVTLLTSLIFIFAMTKVFEESRLEQNEAQLNSYFFEITQNNNLDNDNPYNGYVVYDGGIIHSYNLGSIDHIFNANQLISRYTTNPGQLKSEDEIIVGGKTYLFRIDRGPNRVSIVFTGNAYLQSVNNPFTMIMRVSFISLVVLGNLIILIWSRITVERVKRLQGEVDKLTKNNYQVPIGIEGSDEITELAQTIEKMRQEIQYSEKTKQEMLQNLSHDFKTPIAVIQSYAEAISDGVSDKSEASIIIKQAEVLNQKVKQLLELNRLEYLRSQNEFESIKIKGVITNIVNNQKYRTNIKVITDLDDSVYFGIQENFYTAFNNIYDNALRYAKTKIVITLKHKKLTFFNDGEPISDKFIEQLFRPYEKGQKGQFGLGMSIVQKTVTHFNLTLKVENIDDGVLFTIEPL
ncbi:MAG: HAMP domain-containing histidine kinase [Acholeplasmataceae bacterium]|nr:HAMP domain-containing histidine kinase [Acholeplasmataceae bacterium]